MSFPAHASASRDRFPTLTGLRGLCILWVVFTHLPVTFGEPIETFRETWGIGVDTFFAISGFLVTRSLIHCHRRFGSPDSGGKTSISATLREFFLRRVSRIFPSYFLLLVIISGIALVVDARLLERLKHIAEILPSFVLFYANYPVGSAQYEIPEILRVLWSISFQEQFYIVLVGLFFMSRARFKELLLAAGVASLLMRFFSAYANPEVNQTAAFQMWLHLRFDAISWSCLAWLYFDELKFLWATPLRARVSSTVIAVSFCAILFAHTLKPGSIALAALYSVKGLVLAFVVRAVCAGSESQSWIAHGLRIPALRKIGVAAFEIYLFNALVLSGLLRLPYRNDFFMISAGMILSTGFGMIVYRYFAQPAQAWVRRE